MLEDCPLIFMRSQNKSCTCFYMYFQVQCSLNVLNVIKSMIFVCLFNCLFVCLFVCFFQVLSLLPPMIIKLLEWVGFSGDRVCNYSAELYFTGHVPCNTSIYYMAGSASGQDEANHVF